MHCMQSLELPALRTHIDWTRVLQPKILDYGMIGRNDFRLLSIWCMHLSALLLIVENGVKVLL